MSCFRVLSWKGHFYFPSNDKSHIFGKKIPSFTITQETSYFTVFIVFFEHIETADMVFGAVWFKIYDRFLKLLLFHQRGKMINCQTIGIVNIIQ